MKLLPENSGDISYIDILEKKISNEVLSEDIADIIEVTYSYEKLNDGSNWNTTLFSKLLGKGSYKKLIENNPISKKIFGEKASKKLSSKINYIDLFLYELNNLSNLKQDEIIKKELLVSSLEYARNNLKMAIVGLPFELEKAGVSLDISDEKVEERVKELEVLEKESFGGKISENPEEMELIYNFMKSNFDDFKTNLTIQERNEYKKYLFEIEDKINLKTHYEFGYKYKKPKENKNIHPALKLEMGRDDYKKVFEAIPKIMSSDKEVEISDKHGSFYDGLKWYIPGNNNYKSKSLEYILSTAVHEAFHLTTEMLGKKNVGGTRGGGYLEREEGMAVYLEYLIKGEEAIVGLGEPRLLVGELFDGKKTEIFIDLHNKLNPARASGNILRNKRNYPKNYKGAQHKDSSYGRGLRQIKEILEGRNIDEVSKKSLFMGKMNFDFLKKHGEDYKADIPTKILYPFIMGEMMKFYSIKYYDSKKQGVEYKFDGKQFKEYMDKKYSSIDLEGLTIKDNEFFLEKNYEGQRIGGIINGIKKEVKKVIDLEFENKKVA